MSKITNQNVNTIIFPADMELRKVKKKKKKSGVSAKKKQAIADLRQALQDFDAIINEAKNKKVSIPANLGSLPQDIKDVDSVKEIIELTNDIRQRIQQIRALIEQASKPQADMFRAFIPTQGQAPRFAPQPITPTPQPQPITPTPIQPQPTPTPITPTPPEEDKTAQTLEELKKEILDKLSPEERAKAEEQLKEEGFDVPDEPSSEPVGPVAPDEPVAPDKPAPEPVGPVVPEPEPVIKPMQVPEGFERDRARVGTQTVDVIAPTGFFDFVEKVRKYKENIGGMATQVGKGEFKLTADNNEKLLKRRDELRDEYKAWSDSLTQEQKQGLMQGDDDTVFKQNAITLRTQITRVLTQDPTEVLIRIVGAKGKVYRPGVLTPTEKKLKEEAKGKESEAVKEFKEQLKSIIEKIDNEVIGNTEKKNAYERKEIKREDAVNEILKSEDRINALNNTLTEQYNKLEPQDEVIAEVEYNEALLEISDALDSAENDIKDIKPKATEEKTVLTKEEQILVDFAKGKGNYTPDIRKIYGEVFSNHRAMMLDKLRQAEGIKKVREQVKNDLIKIHNLSADVFN